MGIEESLEKILGKLELIENKIDSMATRIAAIEGNTGSLGGSNATSGSGYRNPSDIAIEQKMGEKVEIEGRLSCPMCESLSVITRDDKTKAISYSGGMPIYGKKYYCKSCGHEFR